MTAVVVVAVSRHRLAIGSDMGVGGGCWWLGVVVVVVVAVSWHLRASRKLVPWVLMVVLVVGGHGGTAI